MVHLAPGATTGAPPNLTRDDARIRAATIRTHSYRVELDLTDGAGRPGEKTFRTRTVVRFDAEPGASTFVDFVGDGIGRAALNGRELDVSGWTTEGGLPLTGLDESNELEIDAVGLYTNTGEGLHRFVDPVDNEVYLYSQFETADAKRMFACFDQPDLKATLDLTVVAPAHWQVVGNGATVGVQDGPSGSKVHTFATTPPMSTYIAALVAGPYHVARDHHDGIDLGLFCRSSLAEFLDTERLFTETKQGFDFFHQAFGVRYPFGKYDQLFVPEFNAGAMENAGAVTFREEYVFRSKVTRYLYERRNETVLHEMAHMWFGDLVTMRWWDDLWLNESFATWASVLAQSNATEYTSAWTTFANVEKSWAYVQDQLPSTHPIAADMVDLEAVEVNFDGITYAKGAGVLKQLTAYVGQEEFLAGLRTYFEAHAFGNAELADLLGHLEESSGRDLSTWGASWLQTTGINGLSARFTTGPDPDGADRFTSFEVVQTGAQPGAGELRPHRLAIGLYDERPGTEGLHRLHRVEIDVTGEITEVPELVGLRRPALILVNDDDLTYCKLLLDPQSLATAVQRVGEIADSLPRTLVWSSAWEMVRDGGMRARDFVAMVARGIGSETEIGVVQRLLMQTQMAVAAYAEPGWADEQGWALFTGTLFGLAHTAAPGGDVQLAAVTALAQARLTGDQVAVLQGWLDGTAPLDGLTVDTDLSWNLLGALVAHGTAGPDRIATAAQADATASGQRQATRVGALLPTAENKQAVWQRLLEDDGMANALQDAAIAGFSHPAQTELLMPFTAGYFDVIDDVWARRSSEVGQKVVNGLYPRWAVSDGTVDLARAWEAKEHPPALSRLVSEGRAGTERSLRARAADAQD